MRVFITGATGLVGRQLAAQMLNRRDEVLCLTRDPASAREVLPDGVEIIGGDPTLPGVWQDRLATCDGVVNLAGESVADGRWTSAKKKRLRRSRLATTENVVAALGSRNGSAVLVSASAVGYYGDQGDVALSEDSQPGQDFLSRLALEWEHAASQANKEDIRVVLIRIGIVLSTDGGALPRIMLPFRLGFGGPMASGRQYFPWIHLQDLVRAILFALDHEEMSGPVNAVVPDPPRQREFAAQLGQALGKPSWLPVPGPMLELVLGEFGKSLLASQRAVPNVLKASGFRFQFGETTKALADLLP